MFTLWNFLAAIPELLELIRTIQTHNKEVAVDAKVKDSVKTVSEAFRAKDPEKLNALMSGK